jgi:hypothetical protein
MLDCDFLPAWLSAMSEKCLSIVSAIRAWSARLGWRSKPHSSGIGSFQFRYPITIGGKITRSLAQSLNIFPSYSIGLRIVLFEDCSAFTRVTACTLALSPIRDTLIEGFSHFVASMTAPIASGWSGCRVEFAPTGKRRLVTAHTQLGHREPRRHDA